METHASTGQQVVVQADGIPDAVAERLHVQLSGLVARKGIHHAILAVERGDGSLRWMGAAGVADACTVGQTAAAPLPFRFVPKVPSALT